MQMSRVRRNRIVIFRLTQAEYDRLKLACAAAGARTLSDYTRSELLHASATDSQGLTNLERFRAIDEKLSDLKTIVNRVSERVAPEAPRIEDAAPDK